MKTKEDKLNVDIQNSLMEREEDGRRNKIVGGGLCFVNNVINVHWVYFG